MSKIFGDLQEGEVRMFVKDVDFTCSMSALRRMAGSYAKNRGLKAATKKMSETEILIQLYPAYRGPTILCSPLAKCLN